MGRLRVEIYRDVDAFRDRLLGAMHKVTFDDIATAAKGSTPFAADRYAKRFGLIIRGADGQFADRTFRFPKDYVPVSAPNMYAPGPARRDPPDHSRGGHETKVSFTVKGRTAHVTGFGLWFLDADHTHRAKCKLTIRGAGGALLCSDDRITTPHGGRTFIGMVTVDRSGHPVPRIESVEIGNGSEYPAIEAGGDGVALDDFLFGIAIAKPVPGSRPAAGR